MITALIFAAILPSLVLMYIIWKEDKIEKESPGLLLKLFIFGILAAFCAMGMEMILSTLLLAVCKEGSLLYIILDSFLCVAVVEEGFKLLFCKECTWRSPEFNFHFDGVVYAVFVSMGFAAMENVLYIFSYGIGVLPARALFSIPAHMGFAVFMGSFYGTAKIYDAYGSPRQSFNLLMVGYLIAVLLHGFYDTCATIESTPAMIIFFVFVVIMDILVIRRIRLDSKNDRLIHY